MGWKKAFERWNSWHRWGTARGLVEIGFAAGYRAARRDLAVKEEKSRRALSKAEATIASQVAAGGLAGERELTAEESAAAAGALLEAVERVGSAVAAGRKRVA